MTWRRLIGSCITALLAAVLPACDSNPGGPGPIVNAPTVQSITPNTGSNSGGTNVTIRGLNFSAGATVMIGGRPAANVLVPSADLITATTPEIAGSGAVDVIVTTGAGSGTLPGGFTYGAQVINAPPVITAITAQGNRARQPANFADLGEAIAVTANVTDLETPLGQLEYHWTASLGAISGAGATVSWQAPAIAATPIDVSIGLRVIERYGVNASLQHEVTRTRVVSLHDSTREVGDMARRFLIEFSKPETNQEWRDVMRDFDLDLKVCPDPKTVNDEREQVERHYNNFVMHTYDIGTASVTINFGGRCMTRTGDACVSVPVSWDSTDKRDNKRAITKGVDYLTAMYASSEARWRLCSSDFSSSSTLSGLSGFDGHSFYAR